MKRNCSVLVALILPFALQAQFRPSSVPLTDVQTLVEPDYGGGFRPGLIPKLYQRNHGMIIGLQRGRSTSLELGYEMHWRKMSWKKPRITGATANMEYNFGDHVVGYKAGMWMKQGRVNFTYGANVGYFTDFKGKNIYSFGPSIGFRLMGLHLVNGYNFLAGNNEETAKQPTQVNTLYISLRYYFPVENKFTWDKREKKKRQKERAKRKREREQQGNEKGIWKLFQKNDR